MPVHFDSEHEKGNYSNLFCPLFKHILILNKSILSCFSSLKISSMTTNTVGIEKESAI